MIIGNLLDLQLRSAPRRTPAVANWVFEPDPERGVRFIEADELDDAEAAQAGGAQRHPARLYLARGAWHTISNEYRGNGPPEPYAAACAAWVRRAHPTREHFSPLLIALGAAEEA